VKRRAEELEYMFETQRGGAKNGKSGSSSSSSSKGADSKNGSFVSAAIQSQRASKY